MNLSQYLHAKRGRIASLAEELGTYPANVCDWAKGVRQIPVKYGAQIELWSGGNVTRQELFPDCWEKVWPELLKKRRKKELTAAE